MSKVTRNNVWKTTHALTRHYARLTNYRRVLEREYNNRNTGDYFIDAFFLKRELLLTELLIGIIKKLLIVKLSLEAVCSEMDLSYSSFNNYLFNGKIPDDYDLIKMARFINS